jgi:hypothetical protein
VWCSNPLWSEISHAAKRRPTEACCAYRVNEAHRPVAWDGAWYLKIRAKTEEKLKPPIFAADRAFSRTDPVPVHPRQNVLASCVIFFTPMRSQARFRHQRAPRVNRKARWYSREPEHGTTEARHAAPPEQQFPSDGRLSPKTETSNPL